MDGFSGGALGRVNAESEEDIGGGGRGSDWDANQALKPTCGLRPHLSVCFQKATREPGKVPVAFCKVTSTQKVPLLGREA